MEKRDGGMNREKWKVKKRRCVPPFGMAPSLPPFSISIKLIKITRISHWKSVGTHFLIYIMMGYHKILTVFMWKYHGVGVYVYRRQHIFIKRKPFKLNFH